MIFRPKYIVRVFSGLLLFTCHSMYAQNQDYTRYHQLVLAAEGLVAKDSISQALDIYDEVFTSYDFVFLRDHKVAAQLAVYAADYPRAFDYLGLAVANGWKMEELTDLKSLKPLKKHDQWAALEINYEAIREDYTQRINQELREHAKQMYAADQKTAQKYRLVLGEKAKQDFINQKIIPLTASQMQELGTIMESFGYPGEKLIGNSQWMATILSHHNSISRAYQTQDIYYSALKPKLIQAIARGELSPYDFAIIDDWHISVLHDGKEPSYGYLNPPGSETNLAATNELRATLGIRSTTLRNELIDFEQKTGINFFLAGKSWAPGKIQILKKGGL